MRRFDAFLRVLCSLVILATSVPAQNAIRIDPPRGGWGWITRPYQQRFIPPINLANTDRLQQLVRAGNLYLSGQDVIALALENNLDIEIQRYGPLLYREVTKRAQGGGLLRTVGVGVAQGPTSVSLTGVSVNASGGGGSTAVVTSQGGILTQLGFTAPNLDPALTFTANFAHTTSPQSNTVLTGTTALINDSRAYQAAYNQNFNFGMTTALTYSSTHNKFNSLAFTLNPYTLGNLDLQISQNLLQGFGRAVNTKISGWPKTTKRSPICSSNSR